MLSLLEQMQELDDMRKKATALLAKAEYGHTRFSAAPAGLIACPRRLVDVSVGYANACCC